MQHLDEGTIHAWLDRALDAAESSRVERHVAECGTCSEAVAEARGMIAGASRIVSSLDVIPGNVIPRSSGKAPARGWLWRSLRLTPGRAALAATLLLAVGTMLTVQHAPSRSASKAIATGAATPVVAVAPSVGPEPVTPAPAAQMPAAGRAPSIAMRDANTPPANARAKTVDTAVASTAEAVAPKPSAYAASAAAPAASDAAPAKQAAKAQATNALSEVVATSSGAVRKVDSAHTDTLGRPRANAIDSLRSAAVIAARARQLSAVQRAGGAAFAGAALRVNEAAECYRVSSDSTAVWQGVAFFPRQFSLQQTAGSPPQNVVRAVSPDGRVDSAIAGARWERITPTTTILYLTRAGGEFAPTLTLDFADRQIAGRLSTPAGLRNVDVVRGNCRP